jgi:hypothetical protein
MRDLALQLQQRLPAAAPRQLRPNHRRPAARGKAAGPVAAGSSAPRAAPSFYGEEGLDLEDAPVRCLGQLFTQAACLNPILVDKVAAWAAASGGCLLRGGGQGAAARFVAAAELGDGCPVQWAKVKSTGRAIEKTVRSYHGVSQARQPPCPGLAGRMRERSRSGEARIQGRPSWP